MKLFIFSLLIISSSTWAMDNLIRPNFPACQGKALMYEEDYLAQKKIWDESKQCGIDVQVVSKTTFWEAAFSKLGTKAESKQAVDFLSKVGKKALSFIEQNNIYSNILIHCAKEDEAWFKNQNDPSMYNYSLCEGLLDSVRETITLVRPHLRYNLALASYRVMTLQREALKPEDNINWKLKEARGTIAPKMEPLNGYEMGQVIKAFNKDTKEIESVWNKFNNTNDETNISLMGNAGLFGVQISPEQEYQNYLMLNRRRKQNEYKARYLELLTQVPILAYLGSGNPTNAELAKAAEKLLENGVSEHNKIKRIFINDSYLAADPSKIASRAKDMMVFMQYGPVVNELLAEEAHLCGDAQGISSYVKKVSMRNNVAIVAGMVGISVFAGFYATPLVAGTALGALSGATLATIAVLPISGLVYYHDYSNYVQSQKRTFNAVETIIGGKTIGDIDSFSRAKGIVMINLAIAATGIDLWGGGLGKGAFFLSSAAISGKSLSEESTKLAFKKILAKKNFEDATIQIWMKNLNSADPKIIERTILSIMQEASFSKNELKLFQSLVSKIGKDFSSNDMKRLELFFYRLPVDDTLRGQVVEESLKIIQKLPPQILTGSSRHEKLRLMVSMLSLGGKADHPRIISLMKEWDGKGLNGLIRTYELAGEKIHTLPPGSFSSHLTRQKKAYGLALDDLLKEQDELKALSKTEKKALKNQMIRCGF